MNLTDIATAVVVALGFLVLLAMATAPTLLQLEAERAERTWPTDRATPAPAVPRAPRAVVPAGRAARA